MAHTLKYCLLLLFLVANFAVSDESTAQFRFRSSSRYAWPESQRCSSIPQASGGKISLVHWNSCWARHYPGPKLNPKDLLRTDKLRLNLLYQSYNSSLPALPASGINLLYQNYSSSLPALPASGITLGTRQFVLLLPRTAFQEVKSLFFVDTASQLTWERCNKLNHPPFDRSTRNSRLANIPCSCGGCTLIGYRCDDLRCFVAYHYQNGSYSSGYFSKNKFLRIAEQFKYGCGDSSGITSVLGLGWRRIMPGQEDGMHAFSYCLPEDGSTVGFLSSGAPAPPKSNKETHAYPSYNKAIFMPNTPEESKEVVYTPILSNPDTSSLYFVGLVGLSVGGQNLDLPESVFTGVRTVLDSDTTVSYLPPEAYAMLRHAFRGFMAAKYRPAGSFSVLDTCYNFTGMMFREVGVPQVGLLFENGATFELSFDQTIYYTSDSTNEEIGCLAFAATKEAGEFSVIGNVQQRCTEVIYDLIQGRIGFIPGSC